MLMESSWSSFASKASKFTYASCASGAKASLFSNLYVKFASKIAAHAWAALASEYSPNNRVRETNTRINSRHLW